jgi:hypothetical protein
MVNIASAAHTHASLGIQNVENTGVYAGVDMAE